MEGQGVRGGGNLSALGLCFGLSCRLWVDRFGLGWLGQGLRSGQKVGRSGED